MSQKPKPMCNHTKAECLIISRPPVIRLQFLCSIAALIIIACCGCHQQPGKGTTKVTPEVTFKPQEMADALHAVIAADREVYARHILQRLAFDEKLLKTSPHWQEDKALPVPAQALRLGSEAVQQK